MTIEGMIPRKIISAVENFPAIQIMIVVTSPTGDQAPPALAAITIHAAAISTLYHLKNLVAIANMTRVAVRLSIMADRKKVTTPITRN